MSEVKRYDLGACYAHMYGLDVVECAEGDFVLASDYDKDTKALEDKARNQHARDSAELRDLCSQRDGFKAELWRVKEERDKLADELEYEKKRRRAIDDEAFNYSEQVEELKSELAELKAVMAESLDNYRAMLHDSETQVEGLKAKMEGMVPAALGSAFITCESSDAGYRVVIKSETLQAAQQVHNWIARLNPSTVSAGEPVPATIGLTEYTYREALKTLREVLDPDDWMGEISMHAFIDAALSAPSRGERVREWISIHDKMPKIGERCLIRIPVGRHFEIEGGEYKGDGDWLGAWCSSKGRNQTYKVSHWMYAPSAAAPSKEGV